MPTRLIAKSLRVSEKFEFCGIRFGWGCQTSHLTVLEAKRAKRLRCNSANARVDSQMVGLLSLPDKYPLPRVVGFRLQRRHVDSSDYRCVN